MKKMFLLWSIILLPFLPKAQAQETVFLPGGILECPGGDYNLVFQDEFYGDAINLDKWNTKGSSPAPIDRLDPNFCDWSKLGAFVEENVEVSDGMLKLWVRRENYLYEGIIGGNDPSLNCGDPIKDDCDDLLICDPFSIEVPFTTGGIFAVETASPQPYGFYELRGKISGVKGLWPAFWMWHKDEIDIFEFFGDPTKFSSNIHKENVTGNSQSETFHEDDFGYDFSEEFHVWGLEWTPYSLRFFLDDELIREEFKYHTLDGEDTGFRCGSEIESGLYQINPKFPSDVGRWFHIYISTAIDKDEDPPSDFVEDAHEIDYIRVYQKQEENPNPSDCTFSIAGQENLCGVGQEHVYILEANKTPENVVWSASSNFEIIEATGEAIKVRLVTGNHHSWIRAEIPPQIGEPCTETVVTTINISAANYAPIAATHIAHAAPYNGGCAYHIGIPFDGGGPGTTWHWTVTPHSGGSGTQTYVTSTPGLYEFFTARYMEVSVYLKNACGQSETYYQYLIKPDWIPDCPPKYIMKLSPNPARTEVEVNIFNEDQQSTDTDIQGELQITNGLGNPILTAPLSGGLKMIDVSNYQEGQYHIFFTDQSGQISVNNSFIKTSEN